MEGIFHTGVTVSNLDKSVRFYRDLIGLELITGPTEVSSGEELSKGVGVPNASLRLAIFKVGEHNPGGQGRTVGRSIPCPSIDTKRDAPPRYPRG